MARLLFVGLLAPALVACGSVASLETAVPRGTEVFEPRLLGEWVVTTGGNDINRLVVTREGSSLYLIRWVKQDEDSAVFLGRLGPLGTRHWILDLAPVADTLRYTHAFASRDSTRVSPPSRPLLMPIHMPLVIDRADSGLRLWVFDADSLQAHLTSRRPTTPFAVKSGTFEGTVLLTESEPQKLNAFLQRFADRPGALVPLPRVGTRVEVPTPY